MQQTTTVADVLCNRYVHLVSNCDFNILRDSFMAHSKVYITTISYTMWRFNFLR